MASLETIEALLKEFKEESKSEFERVNSHLSRLNGSVLDLKLWKARSIGFAACVTVVILPTIFFVAKLYTKA